MQEVPLVLTPHSKLRIEAALREKRIRHANYMRTFLSLTLTDGSVLILTSEAEVLIAIRCLTSGAHAGMSPTEARAAERIAMQKLIPVEANR